MASTRYECGLEAYDRITPSVIPIGIGTPNSPIHFLPFVEEPEACDCVKRSVIQFGIGSPNSAIHLRLSEKIKEGLSFPKAVVGLPILWWGIQKIEEFNRWTPDKNLRE